MLFSSIPFLFYFLPCVFVLYFLVPMRWKNTVLLLASLFFYAWGEPKFVVFMLASIVQGYVLARLVEKYRADRGRAKLFLTLSLVFSLGLLGYCKYADFFLSGFNALTGLHIPLLRVALPIGISFYTFQILSYVVDVYRGDVKAQRNFIDLAAYVAMFPQLIAGPIVRYSDIASQLEHRTHSLADVAAGARRFVLGLGKKVLLANVFYELITTFKASDDRSVLFYWLYAAACVLNIYFDFSGYSDMAVGLARMMNINIPINFNRPFHATSVANFWQRWHISLTNAITACVYMPIVRHLRRPTFSKMLAASAFAFFLVGIWHGAGATFVIFALLQAVGLAVSQIWKHHHLPSTKLGNHVLMFLFIAVSFVFFRAPSLSAARDLLFGMIGRHGIHLPIGIAQAVNPSLTHLIQVSATLPGLPEWTFLTGILLVVFSPDANHLVERLTNCSYLAAALLAVLFLCCVMQLGQTSAFLYFQF